MKPLIKPLRNGEWYPPLSASVLLYAMGQAFGRSIGGARLYLGEQRRAKVAEELYRQLAGLSDAELARRGLARSRLAQYVRDSLY